MGALHQGTDSLAQVEGPRTGDLLVGENDLYCQAILTKDTTT